jgi:DNA-binding winged helix-turn-helix (wHTH) protein
MSAPSPPERQPLLAFGPFLLDPSGPDLFRKGKPVRMQPRPLRALVVLASRPGELVTREELRDALWEPGHFVDFDRGLAFVLREARAALGDDGRAPKYIETLPRRGFRFLAEVERRPRTVPHADPVDAVVDTVDAEPEPELAVVVPPVRPAWRTWPVAIGLAGVLAASFLAMARDRSTPSASATEGLRVAVLRSPTPARTARRSPRRSPKSCAHGSRERRRGVGRVSSER